MILMGSWRLPMIHPPHRSTFSEVLSPILIWWSRIADLESSSPRVKTLGRFVCSPFFKRQPQKTSNKMCWCCCFFSRLLVTHLLREMNHTYPAMKGTSLAQKITVLWLVPSQPLLSSIHEKNDGTLIGVLPMALQVSPPRFWCEVRKLVFLFFGYIMT